MTQPDDTIARVIRRDIQDMHAYAVQPSAGLIKLDAMENPFTLPESLQIELGDRLGRVAPVAPAGHDQQRGHGQH